MVDTSSLVRTAGRDKLLLNLLLSCITIKSVFVQRYTVW